MSVLRTPVSKQPDTMFSQDSRRVPEDKLSDSLEDLKLAQPIAVSKDQSSPSLDSKTATLAPLVVLPR